MGPEKLVCMITSSPSPLLIISPGTPGLEVKHPQDKQLTYCFFTSPLSLSLCLFIISFCLLIILYCRLNNLYMAAWPVHFQAFLYFICSSL
jgi:hypothetical protein